MLPTCVEYWPYAVLIKEGLINELIKDDKCMELQTVSIKGILLARYALIIL